MELEAATGVMEVPVVSREEPEVTARSEGGGEKPSAVSRTETCRSRSETPRSRNETLGSQNELLDPEFC